MPLNKKDYLKITVYFLVVCFLFVLCFLSIQNMLSCGRQKGPSIDTLRAFIFPAEGP